MVQRGEKRKETIRKKKCKLRIKYQVLRKAKIPVGTQINGRETAVYQDSPKTEFGALELMCCNMAHSGRHLSSKVSMWQKRADEHKEKQLVNPFSEWEGASHRAKLDKSDPNYGKPLEGSFTELRGRQAGDHISGEIVELCRVISELGQQQIDNTFTITFGQLFDAYTKISNKLVGMLMRARKQHLVEFDGEMLFQGRDDHVVIKCLKVPHLE